MNIKIKNINEFKNKIFNIFGNEYIVLSNNYENQNSKIKVQHTKCGRIYETTARNLLRGMGCRECSYNKTKNNLKGHIYKKEVKTKEIVESDIRNAIGDDYEFIGEYKNSNTPITIKHRLCGTTYHPLLKNIITHHTGCPKCSNKSYSKGEKELLEYIKSVYSGKIESNIRFNNHYELDIYLPDLKLGFEFNGLYWHSEKKIDRSYHYEKIKSFRELGIHIINIFEDQWENKSNVIKHRIKYEIEKSDIDNCLLIEKPIEFLKENSINYKYCYFIGGYKSGKLVSLVNCNIEKDIIEIDEMININKDSFKVFLDYITEIFKPKVIIGTVDLKWVNMNSNIYTENSFKEIERIPLEIYKDNVWDCGRIIYEKVIS